MILAIFASVAYLASVVVLNRVEKPHHRLLLPIMGVAFVTHVAQVFLGLRGIMNDVSVMNVLTLVAVSMAAIGAIRYFLREDKIAYTVVACIAAVCVWFPVLFKTDSTWITRWSLKIHVTLSIAAYIALGFAALYAIFLLVQDTRLKKGKTAFGFALPLNYIERTMMSFAAVGELLLTLSLATGILFIHDFWGQHIAHKAIFGLLSWLTAGVVLLRHYHQGFRGRQAAFWVLGAFTFLMLAYFGSAFVLQVILQR